MSANLILYSTGCPKCQVLEAKLKQEKVVFQITDKIDELIPLGVTELPVLKVGENYLQFMDAIKYVNNL